MICYIIGGLLLLLVGAFCCIELHYFLRIYLSVILAKFCKRKAHIMDETNVTGICLPNDIDIFLNHMNNARFMREVDFARADFYIRTGLYRTILDKGGRIAMGANAIRYRRFVKIFHRYKISSQIIYWDKKNIYMEHRFTTLKDKFVNAVLLSSTKLINCNAEEVMAEHLLTTDVKDVEVANKFKPEKTDECIKWMEMNDISRAKFRNGLIPAEETTVVTVDGCTNDGFANNSENDVEYS